MLLLRVARGFAAALALARAAQLYLLFLLRPGLRRALRDRELCCCATAGAAAAAAVAAVLQELWSRRRGRMLVLLADLLDEPPGPRPSGKPPYTLDGAVRLWELLGEPVPVLLDARGVPDWSGSVDSCTALRLAMGPLGMRPWAPWRRHVLHLVDPDAVSDEVEPAAAPICSAEHAGWRDEPCGVAAALRRDAWGRTPLHCAARSGDAEVLRELLSRARAALDAAQLPLGTDALLAAVASVRDSAGRSPLHNAFLPPVYPPPPRARRKECAELLAEVAALRADAEGITEIHAAASAGMLGEGSRWERRREGATKALLLGDGLPDCCLPLQGRRTDEPPAEEDGRGGCTVPPILFLAAAAAGRGSGASRAEVVQKLLALLPAAEDRRRAASRRMPSGDTLLARFLEAGWHGAAEVLLRAGADPNDPPHGASHNAHLLECAVAMGDIAAVSLLLRHSGVLRRVRRVAYVAEPAEDVLQGRAAFCIERRHRGSGEADSDGWVDSPVHSSGTPRYYRQGGTDDDENLLCGEAYRIRPLHAAHLAARLSGDCGTRGPDCRAGGCWVWRPAVARLARLQARDRAERMLQMLLDAGAWTGLIVGPLHAECMPRRWRLRDGRGVQYSMLYDCHATPAINHHSATAVAFAVHAGAVGALRRLLGGKDSRAVNAVCLCYPDWPDGTGCFGHVYRTLRGLGYAVLLGRSDCASELLRLGADPASRAYAYSPQAKAFHPPEESPLSPGSSAASPSGVGCVGGGPATPPRAPASPPLRTPRPGGAKRRPRPASPPPAGAGLHRTPCTPMRGGASCCSAVAQDCGSLSALPDDVILTVLHFIGASAARDAGSCCRRLGAACQEDDFWRDLCLTDFGKRGHWLPDGAVPYRWCEIYKRLHGSTCANIRRESVLPGVWDMHNPFRKFVPRPAYQRALRRSQLGGPEMADYDAWDLGVEVVGALWGAGALSLPVVDAGMRSSDTRAGFARRHPDTGAMLDHQGRCGLDNVPARADLFSRTDPTAELFSCTPLHPRVAVAGALRTAAHVLPPLLQAAEEGDEGEQGLPMIGVIDLLGDGAVELLYSIWGRGCPEPAKGTEMLVLPVAFAAMLAGAAAAVCPDAELGAGAPALRAQLLDLGRRAARTLRPVTPECVAALHREIAADRSASPRVQPWCPPAPYMLRDDVDPPGCEQGFADDAEEYSPCCSGADETEAPQSRIPRYSGHWQRREAGGRPYGALQWGAAAGDEHFPGLWGCGAAELASRFCAQTGDAELTLAAQRATIAAAAGAGRRGAAALLRIALPVTRVWGARDAAPAVSPLQRSLADTALGLAGGGAVDSMKLWTQAVLAAVRASRAAAVRWLLQLPLSDATREELRASGYYSFWLSAMAAAQLGEGRAVMRAVLDAYHAAAGPACWGLYAAVGERFGEPPPECGAGDDVPESLRWPYGCSLISTLGSLGRVDMLGDILQRFAAAGEEGTGDALLCCAAGRDGLSAAQLAAAQGRVDTLRFLAARGALLATAPVSGEGPRAAIPAWRLALPFPGYHSEEGLCDAADGDVELPAPLERRRRGRRRASTPPAPVPAPPSAAAATVAALGALCAACPGSCRPHAASSPAAAEWLAALTEGAAQLPPAARSSPRWARLCAAVAGCPAHWWRLHAPSAEGAESEPDRDPLPADYVSLAHLEATAPLPKAQGLSDVVWWCRTVGSPTGCQVVVGGASVPPRSCAIAAPPRCTLPLETGAAAPPLALLPSPKLRHLCAAADLSPTPLPRMAYPALPLQQSDPETASRSALRCFRLDTADSGDIDCFRARSAYVAGSVAGLSEFAAHLLMPERGAWVHHLCHAEWSISSALAAHAALLRTGINPHDGGPELIVYVLPQQAYSTVSAVPAGGPELPPVHTEYIPVLVFEESRKDVDYYRSRRFAVLLTSDPSARDDEHFDELCDEVPFFNYRVAWIGDEAADLPNACPVVVLSGGRWFSPETSPRSRTSLDERVLWVATSRSADTLSRGGWRPHCVDAAPDPGRPGDWRFTPSESYTAGLGLYHGAPPDSGGAAEPGRALVVHLPVEPPERVHPEWQAGMYEALGGR
eukprot:TRINITY_DN33747_c0_g1_i2.p1 TRINITY_DN33747_c0_g1~~TRINITY_DN33747_c0_g1_i2.p1  ORF type:complete len:2070 (+),score=331.24 TRINITY_DN33747_c0_g1_i2:99-6308(+)